MRTLKTSEAAALLHVSANTLRGWEQRFGYPTPQRSSGKHRLYAYTEVIALRDALEQGLAVSSAISVARDAAGADSQSLIAALLCFRAHSADEVIERSLALRSVERTLEEVLLPALDTIRLRQGLASALWAYSTAWSEQWLQRVHRLASARSNHGRVILGNASHPPLDPASMYTSALELCCARSGIEVLSLPVGAYRGLSSALDSLQPDLIVLSGAGASRHEIARWTYEIRKSVGPIRLLAYHSPFKAHANVQILHWSPLVAHAQLSKAIISERAGHSPP
jgi:DNA-binding transcriptional MerR regulator